MIRDAILRRISTAIVALVPFNRKIEGLVQDDPRVRSVFTLTCGAVSGLYPNKIGNEGEVDIELGFAQVKRQVQGGSKRVTLLHVQDKALGHPVRLALGACYVCELLELSEVRRVSGPTVSQHLLVLKSAGVIGDERRGQRI